MRKLIVFNHISLDGYFTDRNGDMSWAHKRDAEWNAFVQENASGNGELLFGRITYEMMAGFWPTPFAMENFPAMAEGMNRMPKVVFSRTLEEASWSNSRLVNDEMAGTVRKMKGEPGPDMVIMGSGSIVSQLAEEGLIDEFQMVLSPTVIGKGRTMFETVTRRLNLKRTRTRAFENGNVLVCYEPAA